MIEPIVSIRIQTDDFSQDQILRSMRDVSNGIGAVCCFTGLMRDSNDGRGVQAMELEHYPGMTEKSIATIIDEAATRWPLIAATVVHRVGTLLPSDQIVLVATASTHRQAAFAACEFIMDFLKTRAPFWKKERTVDGERWVDARSSDDDATKRW
jgi:molybdopterin synthase catalytic subunit